MIWPFENDTSAVIKNMAQKSIAFDKKKNLFCISAIVVAVAMIMMSLLTVQILFIRTKMRFQDYIREFSLILRKKTKKICRLKKAFKV